MKKDNRGGYRPGSGRKPLLDKKEAVNLWLPASTIKKHGGKEKLKSRLEAELQ